MTDWLAWHRSYEDPGSWHTRRLELVRRRVSERLDALGPGRLRILSLCAGDGRDLLPVVAARAAPDRPTVRLVELDPTLAEGARARARALGLDGVDVVTGDAGDVAAAQDVAPVDLLLLCGIFGNVDEADIMRTLQAVPALVRAGGAVIWTRGSRAPDRRAWVRAQAEEAGLVELSFDGAPEPFGVGVATRPDGIVAAPLPARLFTFTR